jgi:hypothetical protein
MLSGSSEMSWGMTISATGKNGKGTAMLRRDYSQIGFSARAIARR